MIHTNQIPTDAQLAIITEQLGRPPRGLEAVAATDSHGRPLVLRMAPIVDDAPFPTLYWLSCERLKVVLSRLEASGVIKELEARLQQKTFLQIGKRESLPGIGHLKCQGG